MDTLYRVIDANLNRAAEGIRVVEDIVRFCHNHSQLTEKLRSLRHAVRNELAFLYGDLLQARNVENDVGITLSQELKDDKRGSETDTIIANFKRVQEAIRTIEETLKVLGRYECAKAYERIRASAYEMEQQTIWWLTKKAHLEHMNGIYGITASPFSCGRSNIEVVKAMLDAGIRVVQYREKDYSLKRKFEECLAIRKMTREAGATFIVNDHADLACMVGADGIHIGQDDWPVEAVRHMVGQDMIIGVSTHSPVQAQAAVAQGADYIGVGPLFRTFTKKDVCEPVGLEYLNYAVKNIHIPFVAIGGIKEANIAEVVSCGAGCICLVTEIVGAESISSKIKRLYEIIQNTVNGGEIV